jgi:hypothetical protein
MTTRSSRLAAIACLVFAVVTTTAFCAAAAEPTLADVETARAMYVEGLELRDRNRLADSLARFRAAYALAATPITGLELGRALMLVGQLLEAREVLLAVERMPPKPEESAKAANARTEARTLAEQIKARIPSVHVSFDPKPDGEPKVTIDGVLVPTEALGAARRLNPGKHVVVAELDGERATAEVDLGESEARPVTLSLGASKPPHPPRPIGGPTPKPVHVTKRDDTPREVWFYGGLTFAGLGVAIGTVTGILAFSSASNLGAQCTGSHCARSAQGDIDTSRSMGTVSTVAFIVAGVGAAAALIELLTRPTVRPNAAALSWPR